MLKYLFAQPTERSTDGEWLDVPPGAEVFPYHREHGLRVLLFGLILVAVVEATALHWLISLWSHWLAVAATLTSVWLILQILAQIRAIGLRPIYIDQGQLFLRNGAFDIAHLPLADIESIEKSLQIFKIDTNYKPLRPFLPEILARCAPRLAWRGAPSRHRRCSPRRPCRSSRAAASRIR